MEKSEKIKRMCSLHNKEIIYICFNSAWHCEIMCCDCLPDHSQNHLKNKSFAKIESFETFLKQYLENLNNKFLSYEENLKDFENYIKMEKETIFSSNEQLKELNNFRKIIFEEIDKRILEIEKTITIEIIEKYENNKKIIEKTQKEIFNLKNDLEKHVEIIKYNNENEKIIESIKFSSKFLGFHERKIENLDYKSLLSITLEKQLNINMEKLKKILNDEFFSIIRFNEISFCQKDEINKKTNKIKESKNLKKFCKICGMEMSFISDFKKHLVCAGCNTVKRLYEKKI